MVLQDTGRLAQGQRPTGFSRGQVRQLSLQARWAILVVVALAVTVPTFLGRGMWRFDEVRWGEVARELSLSHNWFVLRILGEYYPDKPPLYFWVSAALMKFSGGANRVTPRLLSALSVFGVALLTWKFGARGFGRRVGLAAAVIWMTCLLPALLATSVAVDPLYCLLITGSLTAAGLALCEGSWGRMRGVMFSACVAAALFTKGPIGLLLPLASIGVVRLLGLRFPSGTGRVVAWSVIAGLSITALWLIEAASEAGLDVILRQVGLNGFGYAANSWAHPRPPWFFLWTFWRDFFPAALFVPAALAAVPDGMDSPGAPPTRFRFLSRIRSAAQRHPMEYFLLAWAATILVLHSAFSGKRSPYIMPAFPAMALLLARAYVASSASGAGTSPNLARPLFLKLDAVARWILGGLLVALGITALLHPLYVPALFRLLVRKLADTPGIHVGPLTVAQHATLFAGGVIAPALGIILLRRIADDQRRPVPRVIPVCVATGILLIMLTGAVGGPLLDPLFSGRSLVAAAAPYVQDRQTTVILRDAAPAWLLAWHLKTSSRIYAIESTFRATKALLRAKPPVVAILERDQYRKHYEFTLKGQFTVLARGLSGTETFLILGRGIEPRAASQIPNNSP